MAKRKKRPKLSLADLLFTPIDWFCKTLASLVIGTFRLAGKGLLLIGKGAAATVVILLKVIAKPFELLYRHLTSGNRRARQCLKLTGEEFENYIADILPDNGFRKVEQTKLSGDQGADILCERGGIRYAVQCKNYQGAVGNWAVQEAYAGMQYYDCEAAAVICPGTFTRSAKELAESVGVELWDGEMLEKMMRRSGLKPKHKS